MLNKYIQKSIISFFFEPLRDNKKKQDSCVCVFVCVVGGGGGSKYIASLKNNTMISQMKYKDK